uniref:CLIC N-terminal domain-containing protein n=1 Tax=Strigamia maritima TaxID=126957 RepID=T1JKS1_STRMM
MMCSAPCNDLGQIKLFVKAGADGQRYGACPLCQRAFMVLVLKSQSTKFDFRVITVNLAKPLDEFRDLGLKRLPALAHGDRTCDTVDDIVQYIDDNFVNVDLSYDNIAAENACKNFFSKFCFFVKEVSKDSAHLLSELHKLNEYLSSSDKAFLCGEQICHLDCEVLPKLQHIRVAARSLKDFNVPNNFSAVWRYLYNAYNSKCFIDTCPSDQEIILHWSDKPETPNLSLEQRANLSKEPAKFSYDVPAFAQPVTTN